MLLDETHPPMEPYFAEGELLGYDITDGSPIFHGRNTKTFLKDVRPDLRSRVMVTDAEFDLIGANWTVLYTVILCNWGHTARMKPRDLRYLADCIYCNGRRILPGFNDLETRHPDFVMNHWIHEKNTIDPGFIGGGNSCMVWLRCDEGHEARVSLATRFTAWLNGQFSCRKCQGLHRGRRSLKTVASEHPLMVKEWADSNKRKPCEVGYRAGLSIDWVCHLGHIWSETVAARAIYGTGCPYCSGHRVLAGFNDLATVNPEVAMQWHQDNELRPEDVTAGSNIRVKWLCPQGHEWCVPVNNRKRTGCPECARTQISLVERLLWERVERLVGGVEIDARIPVADGGRNRRARCDAMIDDVGLVLEYDGEYWHRERHASDLKKSRLLLEAGWALIRIREHGLRSLEISDPDYSEINAGVWSIPTTSGLEELDRVAQGIGDVVNRRRIR